MTQEKKIEEKVEEINERDAELLKKIALYEEKLKFVDGEAKIALQAEIDGLKNLLG